jgi:Tail tubular protein
MTKLEVINEMLGGLGELPVVSLTDGHPLVPSGLSKLALANTREQSKGWWFNRELVELVPDTSGFIWLPNDQLSVDPIERGNNYVARGRKLYKPFDKATATKYVFTSPVTVRLIREVPFEDCPATAQSLISLAAQLDFCRTHDADTTKLQLLSSMYREAATILGREDITASDLNILENRDLPDA